MSVKLILGIREEAWVGLKTWAKVEVWASAEVRVWAQNLAGVNMSQFFIEASPISSFLLIKRRLGQGL